MPRLIALALLLTAALPALRADIHSAPWIMLERPDTVIAPHIHAPYAKQRLGARTPGRYALPLMRKVVSLREGAAVAGARLDVCGLGHCEVSLDGQPVSPHFLDPGWTDYARRAEYVGYDVTAQLQADPARRQHVVAVRLGGGFYNIPRQGYAKVVGTYGTPRLALCLSVTYADGTVQEVMTDSTWRVTPGPITHSSIYSGEDYDERIERRLDGWATSARYDDRAWQQPIVEAPGLELTPQRGTALQVISRHAPRRIFRTSGGRTVYDFGQNMSGIVELDLLSADSAGQTVSLRPAELLHPDSTLNQRVASPYAWRYTTADTRPATFRPRFTYYGFRYVELDGIDPGRVRLTALHTSSQTAARPLSTFWCSNDTLVRVHDLIDWAIRSNMASVLTDCPTREKLGWLEQDYLMLPSMLYRYDLADLYRKEMQDMADAQQPDGMVPTIAPRFTEFGWGFDDTPEWSAAYIIAPWLIYRQTGDDSLLRRHYDGMRRYLYYLHTRAHEAHPATPDGRPDTTQAKPPHIIAYGLGDWYDLGPDGPGYAQLTSNGVTATATYYACTRLMAQIATLTGRSDDARTFGRLADSIRVAYNALYLHPAGRRASAGAPRQPSAYDRGSQTAQAISLALGLVPQRLEADIRRTLTDDLERRLEAVRLGDVPEAYTTSDKASGQRWPTVITAGDVGFVYLVRALSDIGRAYLLVDAIVNRTDIPGYGMQLARGATALTESWQALERVSNNHLMLGHLMEWLYGGLAGIAQSPTSVGYRHLRLHPQMGVAGITECRATYDAPSGHIASAWTCRLDAQGHIEHYTLDVEVPDGADAEVVLPDKTLKVGSGRHHFAK